VTSSKYREDLVFSREELVAAARRVVCISWEEYQYQCYLVREKARGR